MDFKEVCIFFDNSIFHEECRPVLTVQDFKLRLETLQSPQNATEEDAKLRTLILVGIFSILRGQTDDTIKMLAKGFESTEDTIWKTRLAAYSKYADTVQSYHPLLRFRLRKDGPRTLLHKIERPKSAYADTIKRVKDQLSAIKESPPLCLVEYAIFRTIEEPSLDVIGNSSMVLRIYSDALHFAVTSSQRR